MKRMFRRSKFLKALTASIFIGSAFFGWRALNPVQPPLEAERYQPPPATSQPEATLEPTAPGIRIVTQGELKVDANLRREKDYSAATIIDIIPQGAMIEVVEEGENWSVVKWRQQIGWLHNSTFDTYTLWEPLDVEKPTPTK